MKSILLSGTAALLLVAASGAYAQQDQHQNDNQQGQQDDHAGQSGDHAGEPDDRQSGDQHMSGPNGSADQHNTMSRDRTQANDAKDRAHQNDTDHSSNGYDRDHNKGANDRDRNNNMSDPDRNSNDRNNNRMDRSGAHPHAQISVNLRITVNATRHFRGPAWHPPAGYAYRRYTIGARLEPAFFARDYWLTDYATYDLIAPPDGYTWVRFGPDALLIDEDSGEVVRVVYGIFI